MKKGVKSGHGIRHYAAGAALHKAPFLINDVKRSPGVYRGCAVGFYGTVYCIVVL